jgi:uncharacterized protein (TIGR03435 family)
MNRALWVISLSLAAASAQSFEVATIKPAPERTLAQIAPGIRPPCTGGPGSSSPLRLSCQGYTLQRLIEYAYDVKSAQVEGPKWIDEQRFDLLANVPSGATLAQVRTMMQTLLAERFQLVVHREPREQEIYRLIVAKNGFQRQPTAELNDDERRAADNKAREAFMKASQDRIARGDSRPWRRLTTIGTMETFVNVIGRWVDYPVVDATGLEGVYDFSAEWLVGDTQAGDPAPDMFMALEEQLGLKLEQVKTALNIVIVDSAVKLPADN